MIPNDQQVVASPLRDNLRLRVVHVAAGAGRTGVPKHIVQLLKTGAHKQQMWHNLQCMCWDGSYSCCA
jgi:protein tyrosine phosphatase